MQPKLQLSLVILLVVSLALSLPDMARAQATDCGEQYTVRRGDYLSKIAKLCGVSLEMLILSNPQIKNPSRIFVGQVIQIPKLATVSQSGDATVVDRPAEDWLSLTEISKLGIDLEGQELWVDVDLSSQTLAVYRGGQVERTFLVSTGRWRTPTVTGKYKIWIKYQTDDMKGPGYYLRDVPYTMYFYKGYGLHGTYWHDNFGHPMSHGCVNMRTEDAEWVYGIAQIGTVVNVHP